MFKLPIFIAERDRDSIFCGITIPFFKTSRICTIAIVMPKTIPNCVAPDPPNGKNFMP